MNRNMFVRKLDVSGSKFNLKNHLIKLGKFKTKREMKELAKTETAYLGSELKEILFKYNTEINKEELLKELELI